MPSEGSFEALVDEEPMAVEPSREPPPPPPPPAPSTLDADRIEALELQVRRTMDRLNELIEAQLAEVVSGLRADLEAFRVEVQTSLAQAAEQARSERQALAAQVEQLRVPVGTAGEAAGGAVGGAVGGAPELDALQLDALRSELEARLTQLNDQLAEERRELQNQIATTVGAANKWFVKTRDELYERLDDIAEVAADAEDQATAAATAIANQPSRMEWNVGGPEGDALRVELQGVQGEIGALGQSVLLLREEMERLRLRIPSRPRPVHLHTADIELIVEAVLAALSAAPAAPAATPAAAPRARKAPAPPPKKAAKKAPAVTTKKAPAPVKRAARKGLSI